MIKCPACGESSSFYIIDHDTYVWNVILFQYTLLINVIVVVGLLQEPRLIEAMKRCII